VTRAATTYDMVEGKPKFAITLLSVEEFHIFWPGISGMLDTVPHTWKHWTKDWIVSEVEAGRIQVWGLGPPPKAVLIFFTHVIIYPAYKVLSISWGAGSFDPEMLFVGESALMHYARLHGCSEIEMRGRPGYDPHLKAIGAKLEAYVWSLPVPNVRVN